MLLDRSHRDDDDCPSSGSIQQLVAVHLLSQNSPIGPRRTEHTLAR